MRAPPDHARPSLMWGAAAPSFKTRPGVSSSPSAWNGGPGFLNLVIITAIIPAGPYPPPGLRKNMGKPCGVPLPLPFPLLAKFF